MPTPLRVRASLFLASLTLLLAACDQMSSGPRSVAPIQFSRAATLPDVQSQLITGPARVEVSVVPGTLTARRVEIEERNQLTRPERVRSRVTAITAGTDTATLTLELGGLHIAVNGSTQLRPDDGDRDGQASVATLADFVARIQADLAAGRNPAVNASRQPPAQPQAPDDGGFLAATLQLDEGNNHSLIQVNVAAANLTTNATPPPDALLKVLGVNLELRVSDGTTQLRVETDAAEGAAEFHGAVKSVDQTAKTVTLMDGTVIRIVAGSEFEAREGDEDDHLTTLAAVQDALTAGKTVKAEGRGLVDTTNPLTLDAIRIEFEVEGEELPPPVMMVEFRDTVASVDVAGSTLTLGNGAVITVTAQTRLDQDGSLKTLQAVADSLAAHARVEAEGVGTLTSAGPPLAVTALFVELKTTSAEP
jgi:Domain of unknown function (DUF5666)